MGSDYSFLLCEAGQSKPNHLYTQQKWVLPQHQLPESSMATTQGPVGNAIYAPSTAVGRALMWFYPWVHGLHWSGAITRVECSYSVIRLSHSGRLNRQPLAPQGDLARPEVRDSG